MGFKEYNKSVMQNDNLDAKTDFEYMFSKSSKKRKKPKNNSYLVLALIILCGFIWIMVLFDNYEAASPQDKSTTKETVVEYEISDGEKFKKGAYTVVDDVKIKYNGNNEFVIENNSDVEMMISCLVYGKKVSGEYVWLGTSAFYSLNEEQYKKDKEENGWAVYERTNRINSGQKSKFLIELYRSMYDVGDTDLYIGFTVSRQYKEGHTITSTNDKESGHYIFE